MKISIINSTDKLYSKSNFDDANDYCVINTKELNIKYCSGCFGCWLITPGLCVQKDDMPAVLRATINSDLVVYISEVKAGFVSAELKKINDKSIPLLLPYMQIVQDEIHHVPRYEKNPEIGLVLVEKEKIKSEDFEIIKNCYERYACNFANQLKFIIKDNDILGGLSNEIINY